MTMLEYVPTVFFFEPYTLSVSLFERGLALHNFLAFLSFFVQWRGLIGSSGIAPAKEFMEKLKRRGWTAKTRWQTLPTLFWYSCDDHMLQLVQIIGLVSSALAFLGIWSGLNILIAAVCYSSIKCVGSVFTQLQMHAHILEIDAIYVLCCPFIRVCPSALAFMAGLLNFRVMMGGGAGKWFGNDTSWRNGTAMAFHYWTQPLPNPLSPYMHRLPLWLHKAETYLGSLILESFCALFVFTPAPLRFVAYLGFVGLMLSINLTGNFAQISVLTINESILLLNDSYWKGIFNIIAWFPLMHYPMRFVEWFLYRTTHWHFLLDFSLPASQSTFSLWNLALGLVVFSLAVIPYAFIHLIPLVGTFRGHNALEVFETISPKPMEYYKQYKSSDLYRKQIEPRWNVVWKYMEKGYAYGQIADMFSSYVKFGHMTKYRHEIIIEASLDEVEWKEYEFRYKPSLVTKRPIFFPVHLPCLDWRLWFLPLEHARGGEPPPWFLRVLLKLMECEPTVMDLFLSVPYDGVTTPKPRFIRAVLYDYRFAYGYGAHEDEMKKMCKTYRIRDTEIMSEDEEDVQVPIEEKKKKKVKDATKTIKKSEEAAKLSEPLLTTSSRSVHRSRMTASESNSSPESKVEVPQAEDEKASTYALRSKAKGGVPRAPMMDRAMREAEERSEQKNRLSRSQEIEEEDDNSSTVSRSSLSSASQPERDPSPSPPFEEGEMKERAGVDEEESESESSQSSSSEESSDSDYPDPAEVEQDAVRAALARLLGLPPPASRVGGSRRSSLPPPRAGFKWERRKKVTQPVPLKDENGNTVWYVRRRRVGPYGPTLAYKEPSPPSDQGDEADSPAWQQFVAHE